MNCRTLRFEKRNENHLALTAIAQVKDKYGAADLNNDMIVLIRFQGPGANGMPDGGRGVTIAKLKDGDRFRLDCEAGVLTYTGDQVGFDARDSAVFHPNRSDPSLGREMFAVMRAEAGDASSGTNFFTFPGIN